MAEAAEVINVWKSESPKKAAKVEEDSGDDTPSTSVEELDVGRDEESDFTGPGDDEAAVPQLVPGLFATDNSDDDSDDSLLGHAAALRRVLGRGRPGYACRLSHMHSPDAAAEIAAPGRAANAGFHPEETLFVFDWDDTILPSTWITRQGLRLDSASVVQPWQRERLDEVAQVASQTLRSAKQRGTVVLLTNAERGWIELSCTKFVPALLPVIENIKIVSARTTYESHSCTAPLDWKVKAFETEIARACGADTLVDPRMRKNIHSLGDSMHEREALHRATNRLPNCCVKSVKFVERPDLEQLIEQHSLVAHRLGDITHHDGCLDLCLKIDVD